MDNAEKDMAEGLWLLTGVFKEMQAGKWDERAENLRMLAQEATKVGERMRRKMDRAGKLESKVNSVFALEGREEMVLRREIQNVRKEIIAEQWEVTSLRLKIAEALTRWEVEKKECEDKIATQERCAKVLERSLQSMDKLLNGEWLYNEEE
ncbi:hypothetical protein LTR85_012289 [Meristemomyces frigidus]|nr:hypothetical protein LTR85_012289 [Meristemomyces frigidus]